MKPLFNRWAFIATCLLSLLLAACGGSGSSATDTSDTVSGDTDSELLISLTDAEGDFLTYLVDVSSIKLTRSNGAIIEALPNSTSIDFAQYVEVTELLSIATVPAGRYDSAEITLDFTGAQITVQDELGNPLLADVQDSNGDPLNVLTVAVEFSDRDGFTIRRGIPAQITLDFDLDASNEIVIENGTATVTVSPVFLADTILENPKSFRLRGLLGAVSIDDDMFPIDLRPFRHRIGQFGAARVRVTEQTQYEINQQTVPNENGLAAMSALGRGMAVVTEGFWDRANHRYTARYVYAGSSVPWNDDDMVRGTVVSRSGNTLNVRGATIEMAAGQFTFSDTVSVTVGDNTNVRVQGNSDTDATIADISVGSAVYISGVMTGDSEMDATGGFVRVHFGFVAGHVVSAGPLAINASMINGRRIDLFDFTGTGINTANDADPGNYEIDSGTLNLAGILPGDPVRVRGLVMEYGNAPEDFIATTVINAADVRGHMVITYGADGTASAINNLDESGILCNRDNATEHHHLSRAGITTDLNDLAAMPLVVPGNERGIYAISSRQRTRLYTFYSDFLVALSAELNAGALVSRFDAQGFYDDSAALFTSSRFRVKLADAD
jgi:hypothetical protein